MKLQIFPNKFLKKKRSHIPNTLFQNTRKTLQSVDILTAENTETTGNQDLNEGIYPLLFQVLLRFLAILPIREVADQDLDHHQKEEEGGVISEAIPIRKGKF